MTYEFKTNPYSHQKEALKRMLPHEEFALLMEMGTGKTKVAIDEIGILHDRGEINAALILAPKGVYANWPNIEFPLHMPDGIKKMVHLWNGFGTATARRRIEQLMTFDGLSILVMNTEALSGGKTSKACTIAREFLRNRRAVVYVDESTYLKNHKANRTKNATEICTYAKRRRIMTGSPVPRSPLDFFAQFNFLKKGLLGTTSFYAFRARYAIMKQLVLRDRTVNVVDRYQNLDDLRERVEQHSFRVTKEQCLDLPPKVYKRRNVELTKEQRDIYKSLVDDAFAEVGDGFVSTTEVITLILRLHQVVCGHVADADGNLVRLKTNRPSAMLDAIEESSGKVIIWARYREDLRLIGETLAKEFGRDSYVQYHGGVNNRDRETAVDRFQNDPTCRFFVANQQTGGYGITLTAAETVIYYSNDFDLEKRMQSEDRAHRSGQKKTVTYVDLVAPETVDEKILQALKDKKNLADYVTGDSLEEILNGH